MSANRFSNERLAYLLRLLPPAPHTWVVKAKQRLLEQLGVSAAAGQSLTDDDLARLGRALDADPSFRMRFDEDPVAAAEAEGMSDVAIALEHELRELVRLAERVATDEAYRVELDADPYATLGAVGVSQDGAQPLLQALARPDDVLSRVPDVVAHTQLEQSPRARLIAILLRSSAATDRIRAAATSA